MREEMPDFADYMMWTLKGAGVLLAMAYVFLPIDFIPDLIPLIGWFDDGIAVLLALMGVLK